MRWLLGNPRLHRHWEMKAENQRSVLGASVLPVTFPLVLQPPASPEHPLPSSRAADVHTPWGPLGVAMEDPAPPG